MNREVCTHFVPAGQTCMDCDGQIKGLWSRGNPGRRVFALVLWDEASHPIPCVAQYDPKFDTWTSEEGVYPSVVCSYALLPYHPSFSAKTHLMVGSDD